MKHFTCILIFKILLVISSNGQGEDYVLIESNNISVSAKQCESFVRRSNSRIVKLASRIRKTNNYYLHLFIRREDALLYSLCDKPLLVPTSNSLDQIELNTIGQDEYSSPENGLTNLSKVSVENGIPKETKSSVIGCKKQLPNAEDRANALILEAWYCFNRFENICDREADLKPYSSFTELDTITYATNFIKQRNVSENDGVIDLSGFSAEKDKLKKEIKRSELIRNYIEERQLFLEKALADIPGYQTYLLPIHKCSYYYKAQLKEYKLLFKDRSRIEKYVFDNLKGLKNEVQFDGIKEQASNINTISNSVNAESDLKPSIKLDEILLKAPKETTELLMNLKGFEIQNKIQYQKILIITREIIATAKEKSKNANLSYSNEMIYSDSLESNSKNTFTNDSLSQDAPRCNKEKVWTPDPLKTKRTIDRFNYGINVQGDKQNHFFPTSTTIAANASFQFMKNGNIGLGGSYIFGWRGAPSWNGEKEGLRINSCGYGLRSFLDYRLYKSVFVIGGLERNYRSVTLRNPMTSIENQTSHFTNSCMIGLKIRYASGSTYTQPTIEFLYDLLNHHTGQPAFVIRAGVEFNGKHSFRK